MSCRRQWLAASLWATVLAASSLAADEAALAALRARWDAAMRDIKDITVEMTVTMTDEGQTMTSESVVRRKGDKTRIETNVGGMNMVVISDGKDFWMVGPMGTMKMPRNAQNQDVNPLKALPADARIVRSEKVGDRACHVVEYKDAAAPTLVWLDQKTAAMVKTETTEGKRKMSAVFSDHRKILKDYEYPFKCEMSANDKPAGTMVTKSVKVNAGLGDDLFEVTAPATPGGQLQIGR